MSKKKKKRISVQAAKTKGRNLQKWTCEQISKIFNIPWGYEDEKEIQPRIMGQSGTDVVLRGEAFEKFKFDIECKNQETWKVPEYIRQARKNTRKDRDWLLILKRNEFHNKIAVLDAEVFFKLIEENEILKQDLSYSNEQSYKNAIDIKRINNKGE